MDILNQLKADILLHNCFILGQIEKLKHSLVYKTDDDSFSFDDYFVKLTQEIDGLSTFDLSNTVTPGNSRGYLIELSTSLEQVMDEIEVLTNKTLFFMSRVKVARNQVDGLAATFKAWYLIALQEQLKDNKFKLPQRAMDALADSEFSRLLDGRDQSIDALSETLTLLVDRLQSKKKLAQEKYNIGRDQANASIIPAWNQQGFDGKETSGGLLKEKYGLGAKTPEQPKIEMDEDPDEVPYTPKPQVVREDEEYEEPATTVASKASLTKRVTGVINHVVAHQVTLDEAIADSDPADDFEDETISPEELQNSLNGEYEESAPSSKNDTTTNANKPDEEDTVLLPTKKKRKLVFDDEDDF